MIILLSIIVFTLTFYICSALMLFILFCLPRVSIKITDLKTGNERECVGKEKIKLSFIASLLWPVVLLQSIKG